MRWVGMVFITLIIALNTLAQQSPLTPPIPPVASQINSQATPASTPSETAPDIIPQLFPQNGNMRTYRSGAILVPFETKLAWSDHLISIMSFIITGITIIFAVFSIIFGINWFWLIKEANKNIEQAKISAKDAMTSAQIVNKIADELKCEYKKTREWNDMILSTIAAENESELERQVELYKNLYEKYKIWIADYPDDGIAKEYAYGVMNNLVISLYKMYEKNNSATDKTKYLEHLRDMLYESISYGICDFRVYKNLGMVFIELAKETSDDAKKEEYLMEAKRNLERSDFINNSELLKNIDKTMNKQ